MKTVEKAVKIIMGLTVMFFGIRLMMYLVEINKQMEIPTGLPFVAFMSFTILLFVGALLIVWASNDKK